MNGRPKQEFILLEVFNSTRFVICNCIREGRYISRLSFIKNSGLILQGIIRGSEPILHTQSEHTLPRCHQHAFSLEFNSYYKTATNVCTYIHVVVTVQAKIWHKVALGTNSHSSTRQLYEGWKSAPIAW